MTLMTLMKLSRVSLMHHQSGRSYANIFVHYMPVDEFGRDLNSGNSEQLRFPAMDDPPKVLLRTVLLTIDLAFVREPIRPCEGSW